MSLRLALPPAEAFAVTLDAPDDFTGWRDAARRLLLARVPPDRAVWNVAGEGKGDLFAGSAALPDAPADAPQPRVPRRFLDLAGKALLHSCPDRFALLYRLLWRLQDRPGLLDDAADRDVRRLDELVRTVRRDIHKMRAFLRFRLVEEAGGTEHYVAWFEPQHHILRANAAFFVGRFTTMRWSILTPQGSLHWDGEVLREGPPARREQAASGDPAESLWKEYYAAIFNPARLKIGAMLKEMPRRYWKNMPEAELIPSLIAGAQARESAMVERGAARFDRPRPASLAEVTQGIIGCRRCPIGCNGTRAVAGEGDDRAALMIVGEQPGDTEEQGGRPFTGPAGQVLRGHLEAVGIDLGRAWLTNAVKHFKFEQRGKRRLHQSPTAPEIDMCRWWIESERQLVRPRLILALGASAARSLLGKTVSLQKVRGEAMTLEDGAELWITTHPSYLLRLSGDAREREELHFVSDLVRVAERLRNLASRD